MFDFKPLIRSIPDFPTPGILFRDITPLIGDPAAFAAALDLMTAYVKSRNVDAVVVIHARSGDETGVFMGDVIHHPLQLIKPEWSTLACTDRELSRKTRTRLIEEHAERGTRLLPAHFPAPTVGRIVRQGSAYWYAFE